MNREREREREREKLFFNEFRSVQRLLFNWTCTLGGTLKRHLIGYKMKTPNKRRTTRWKCLVMLKATLLRWISIRAVISKLNPRSLHSSLVNQPTVNVCAFY